MNTPATRQSEYGFTLTELAIVMIFMAIIVTIGASLAASRQAMGELDQKRMDVTTAEVVKYASDHGYDSIKLSVDKTPIFRDGPEKVEPKEISNTYRGILFNKKKVTSPAFDEVEKEDLSRNMAEHGLEVGECSTVQIASREVEGCVSDSGSDLIINL